MPPPPPSAPSPQRACQLLGKFAVSLLCCSEARLFQWIFARYMVSRAVLGVCGGGRGGGGGRGEWGGVKVTICCERCEAVGWFRVRWVAVEATSRVFVLYFCLRSFSALSSRCGSVQFFLCCILLPVFVRRRLRDVARRYRSWRSTTVGITAVAVAVVILCRGDVVEQVCVFFINIMKRATTAYKYI